MNFNSQEKEKEANEAAANSTKTAQGEECTIRTNPPLSHSATSRDSNGPAGNGGGVGGSISDACETCSQHKTNSTSREALHKESESKIFNLILFKAKGSFKMCLITLRDINLFSIYTYKSF